MKKAVLTLAALAAFLPVLAQNWQPADKSGIAATAIAPRDSHPKDFLLYQMDMPSLTAQLAKAPLRHSGQASAVVITLPDANGQLQHFRVYNAPVMQPGLAAKYPGIQSYVAQGIEHPATTVRFSTTLYGLHAMALTADNGTWYIDPYTKGGGYYMVYKKSSLQTDKIFSCLTQDSPSHLRLLPDAQAAMAPQDAGNWRTYRTAILATVEYSAFHIAEAGLEDGTLEQKKEAVVAAIAATITRVNSMFERDLTVSLQLVDNEDEVVFIESDEVNNDDAGELLDGGNAVIYATIGEDNFDFGHSFGTNGGGLAAGAPCSDFKAGAMTGLGSPVGDPFDIDYVAHEMGHQFGAPHTFNASCGGNRDNANAYEPGGGTTIMAYAGVCDPVIQWSSDAQFHATSIALMRQRINGESNCVPLEPTGNTPPVANAGADYVIPRGTAFILEGAAIDPDGDALTYDWEQMNIEISAQPPVPNATGGPNFRSLPISESPDRWMPRIQDVLAGNLTPQWEVIPSVGRVLDFALTVRDNNPNGGESHTDYMHIDVVGTAGPFVVTSPNAAVTWAAASNKTVTWNVAGTTANGVNTPFVDILLSTDGGFTYPTVIAEGVPNDGSETIIVPDVASTESRLMARGHDNIFYDISNANFTITSAGSTFLTTVEGDAVQQVCKGSNAAFALNLEYINGFTGATTFTVTGQPAGSTVTFSPTSMTAPGIVNVNVTNTTASAVGDYNIVVTTASSTETKTITLHLTILSTDFAQLQALAPLDGTTTLPTTVALDWSDDLIASSYYVQVATDEAFANIIAEATTTQSMYTLTGLEESTQHYWRVRAANAGCEGSYNTAAMFTTGVTFCNEYASADVPLEIFGGDPSTASSGLEVDGNFELQGISVSIDINHTWLSDVVATLISPAGTEILLFGDECGDQDDATVTFTDGAAAMQCGGTPALNGTFAPEEALSTLVGENVNGTWTLQVGDTVSGDGGAVNNWSLSLCGIGPMLATQQPALADFADFAVWPNPNKGSFTVQFSATGSPATVNVYDMRGRVIYTHTEATAAGLYRIPVQLTAQQGIYMVSAQQDGRKTVKKIVVE
ncbi:reprolysin-like metallopeptidase [Flavobacterium sp. RHBU_24]|uniref:reprolysin-like metallopeptidase n=1 Tax=Flavobacterium sp. RHBU_24 TaxID=3391185 RepID=UPI00398477A1